MQRHTMVYGCWHDGLGRMSAIHGGGKEDMCARLNAELREQIIQATWDGTKKCRTASCSGAPLHQQIITTNPRTWLKREWCPRKVCACV